MPQDPDIVALARMLGEADHVVVFTGAGISTESGIPDFRSPGGVWTKQVPIDFSDFMRSHEARKETWRRRFDMDTTLREAQPNRGHRAVAELVQDGKVPAVITQNIDGLHQESGIPADQVIELHGNTTYAHLPGLCAAFRDRRSAHRVRTRRHRAALCLRRLGEDRHGVIRPVDAAGSDAAGAE